MDRDTLQKVRVAAHAELRVKYPEAWEEAQSSTDSRVSRSIGSMFDAMVHGVVLRAQQEEADDDCCEARHDQFKCAALTGLLSRDRNVPLEDLVLVANDAADMCMAEPEPAEPKYPEQYAPAIDGREKRTIIHHGQNTDWKRVAAELLLSPGSAAGIMRQHGIQIKNA